MNRVEFLQKFKDQGGTKEQAKKALAANKQKGISFDAILTKQQEYKKNLGLQEATQLRSQQKEMAANRPQRIAQARKERFQEMPAWDRMAAGAGSTLYSTPGIKQAYDLATMAGVPDPGDSPEDFEMYRQASEGDFAAGLGEVGADVALMAAPGSALSKAKYLQGLNRLGSTRKAFNVGSAAGLGSGTVHQAQRLQTGRNLDPVGFGTEVLASGALGGMGGKIGSKVKKEAPEVLRTATKPPRKMTESVNPPNFETPLKKGMVPYMGGLEVAEERAHQAVKKLSNQRDQLIKDSKIEVNITDANRKVGKKLNDMVRNKEIDYDHAQNAYKQSVGKIKGAKKSKSADTIRGKLKISGEDAVAERKLADQGSKFNPMKPTSADPDKVIYNEAYRRVLEDEIEKELGKKAGLGAMDKYKKLKSEMAQLIPFQKAAGFRLAQQGNNYKLSLMDLGALGVGSTLGGGSLAARVGTAAGVGTARRLTSTSGGAAMLYDAGESLTRPSRIRDYMTQTGRSTMEGRRQ